MRHFQQIASGIDVSGVMAELADDPSLWNEHQIRRTAPGTPHRASSDLWCRFNDVRPFEAGTRPWSEFNDQHIPINYRAWSALPSLRKITFDLMRQVEAEGLYGVLITKIPPGGRIEPHRDASWHVSFTDKFYLSLQSAPGAVFCCDHDGAREELNPEPGQIWLFDNRRLHWVENNSTEDRITAIICLRTEMFGRHLGEN